MEQKLTSIHPGAKIHPSVEIDPFVTIWDNVEIGEGTRIHSNVTIFPGARIGKNCTIFPGAVISAIPQDLKFHGEDTVAIIGDNNVLRECVTVHRGTASKGKTVIGNNNLIMAYCHVAHDCVLHNNIIMSNAVQLAGEVEVDDYAILGGGSLVHQFVHIGRNVMLQGGTRTPKDIPPFSLCGREPLAYIGLNLVGLRRHNFTTEQIELMKDIYRVIYSPDLNFGDAVKQVQEAFPPSEIRDTIVDFIRHSERGIIQAYRK